MRSARTDFSIVLSIAGILLVTADSIVAQVLGLCAPELAQTFAGVEPNRRKLLCGLPLAVLFLIGALRSYGRKTRA